MGQGFVAYEGNFIMSKKLNCYLNECPCIDRAFAAELFFKFVLCVHRAKWTKELKNAIN